MHTVEMEDFDFKSFCVLGARATEIRMDENQWAHIRALSEVPCYVHMNPADMLWYFMDAKIVLRRVYEHENRAIVFVMPEEAPEPEVWLPFKKHVQLHRHDPDNGVNGDCTRTVIACLLNKESVEEVPHFGEGLDFSNDDNAPIFEQRIDAYLDTQQIKKFRTAYTCGLDDLYSYVLRDNPGVPLIVDGMSPRGTNHSVIYFNGVLAHDPHPDGGGIIGQMNNGQIHVTVLVSVPHMDQRFVG